MADGLARSGFDIDLRQGEVHERALAKLLLDGTGLLEVKTDHIAHRTGRVFVEFEQPTGPSGITTTTASYWAFNIVGRCCILVRTSKLHRLADRAFAAGFVVRGGDYNGYHGVLIPICWLHDNA